MWNPPEHHAIKRLFAGATEYTFQSQLGVADPNLIDYLSTLLARFIHSDAIYPLHDMSGTRLEQVALMLGDAETLPEGGVTTRQIYRHIGDYALFWTGVYPETLKSAAGIGGFGEYCAVGKRSYRLASAFEQDPYREESAVLRRLSDQFEMCAYGLREARREWENGCAGQTAKPTLLIQ